MNKINCFSEGEILIPEFCSYMEDWLIQVSDAERKEIEVLNYIFCDDKYLLEINKKYLNHDYYTDIITFDLSEDENISGDIFISIDRVNENANELSIDFDRELKRVIVHGLLHLIGYDDKEYSDKRTMRKKEDLYLSILN